MFSDLDRPIWGVPAIAEVSNIFKKSSMKECAWLQLTVPKTSRASIAEAQALVRRCAEPASSRGKRQGRDSADFSAARFTFYANKGHLVRRRKAYRCKRNGPASSGSA